MSQINSKTNVYVFIHHPPNSGQRAWLNHYDSARNQLGNLIIVPDWHDTPQEAMSLPYEMALILRRRLETEGYLNTSYYQVHFALDPTGEEIASGNTTSAPGKDGRVVMQYRGLLVRPGHDVNIGPCWFVKFPGESIESVRGDSPEDAVDKTYERNLQHLAEQQPPPEPEVVPSAPKNLNDGYRLRPGSFKC